MIFLWVEDGERGFKGGGPGYKFSGSLTDIGELISEIGYQEPGRGDLIGWQLSASGKADSLPSSKERGLGMTIQGVLAPLAGCDSPSYHRRYTENGKYD